MIFTWTWRTGRSWFTGNGVGTETVGFDLYREQDGVWVKINTALIPSVNPMGASYAVADPGANAADTFRYKLVEYETPGTIQEYGPFDRAVWSPRMESIALTSDGVVLRWLSREGNGMKCTADHDWGTPLEAVAHDPSGNTSGECLYRCDAGSGSGFLPHPRGRLIRHSGGCVSGFHAESLAVLMPYAE
jgi:hypothetical protein